MRNLYNKKNIFIIIALIVSISIVLVCNKNSDNATILDEVKLKDTNTNKGMFAIMLEKTDDSNEYEESNNFPTVGYLYNGEKSGCIDGNNKAVEDVLTYNEETKKVSVKTKQTVYCYLYFKKDSEVPDVTNFYVGTYHGSEYTNQRDNKSVHIEYSDEDVTDYCLTTTNSANDCSWETATSSPIDTTIDLGTDNKKYDYDVYLRDKAGNISELDEASQDEIILDTQAPKITNLRQISNTETSITVSLEVNDPVGTDESIGSGVDKVYFKIKEKNGNYIGSEVGENATTSIITHIFNSNLSAGETYAVEVHAKDKLTNDSILTSLNVTTKAFSRPGDVVVGKNPAGLSSDMSGGLRRFQGTTADNYICFGANDCKSQDVHMYRIIGIDTNGRLKIMKEISIGKKGWDTGYRSNIAWNESQLETVLNSSGFLTNEQYTTNTKWQELIDSVDWKYGDIDDNQANQIATNVYNIENNWTTKINAKIGLIYLHDYYLATGDNANCHYNSNSISTCMSSWIHQSKNGDSSKYQWTMTRYDSTSAAWAVSPYGQINFYGPGSTYEVRPVFYLKSDVKITGGDGKKETPFILSLD